MTGFEVPHEQLDAHAEQVKGIAEKVRLAKQAGDEVGFGGMGAYGLFLQFVIPPTLQIFLGDTRDLLGRASEMADAMAIGVQTNNSCYLTSDQQNAELLKSIQDAGL